MSILTNTLLPTPESWTYLLSGKRDATYIDITLPGEIAAETLRSAGSTFQYAGEGLGAFSAGPGHYDDNEGDLTTSLSYNIGLQEQDPSALIHRGYQLFELWEDEIINLVRGNVGFEDDPVDMGPVGTNTYGTWAEILGDASNYRLLVIYLQEPIEGRLKSIDDVMRYLYDAWQSLLLVEDDNLKLVCLLDMPSAVTDLTYIKHSRSFDLSHDPNEAMEVDIQDLDEPFLLPAGAPDKFPRRIPTIRLNEAEATLEITLQRLREGAHTRRGLTTIPLPTTYAGIRAIRPGQGVRIKGQQYWVTETRLSYPDETATLTLYRAGA